jgi:hypothetical protein
MKMPKTFYPHEKNFFAPSLCDLLNPIHAIPGGLPLLLARGNKPLGLSFEQQLNALVDFHLEEHTSGCHLIARTKYGLMVQILAGLITYLLPAIYCQKHFNERVSITRVRQLRNQIKNELHHAGFMAPETAHARAKTGENPHAKT